MSRRSGLGRGLAALIPPSVPDDADPAEDPDAEQPAVEGAAPEPMTAAAGPTEPAAGGDDAVPAVPEGAPEGPTPDPEPLESPPARSVPEAPIAADASIKDGVPGHEAQGHDGQGHDGQGHDGQRGHIEPSSPAADRDEGSTDGSFEDVPADSSAEPVVEVPAAPPGPDLPETSARAVDGRVPASAATLAEVAPESIVPNPRQPREVFDPEELANLATSLADIGVLQPLVVRPMGDGGYELVAGERRLRAATLAGLSTVPVVIRHTEDADLLKEALVENIHRVQLNPLEEGAAYQQLLEEFGVTQEELATRLGRSRPSISNAIRLLQLPPGVQRRVASGILSAGHAKVLLAIEDPAQQVRLADRIVAEGMSVRATEELVRLRLLDEPATSSAGRRRPVTAPGLVELQDDLADALEARVKISMGAKRGRLAIEFASVDDLERIVSIIANGLEGGREVAPPAPAPGGDASPDHG